MAKKSTRTAAHVAADKRRTGRPPKLPEERRSVSVSIHLTEAEYDLLKRLADAQGRSLTEQIMLPWRSLSAWVYSVCAGMIEGQWKG